MIKKTLRLLQVPFLCSLFFGFQGCQEYIHDSFDTFQGVIVDEAENPIANLELSLYSQRFILGDILPLEATPIYVVNTDATGKFKMVLPSRNYDGIYTLTTSPSLFFAVEQLDAIVNKSYLNLSSSQRNENGVIDLGKLTVVQP